MAAGDAGLVPGQGLRYTYVVNDDGEHVQAVVLCGMQADGTVTPVRVDSDGKLITTT